MDNSLAASVAVRNKNNVWVNDNMVTKCHWCNADFSFLVRKHHCRSCGNVFCYACTNQYIAIPEFITDRPDAADYWNISYYFTQLKGEAERVCKLCYDIITEKKNAYKKIINIFENPPTIEQIKEMPNTDTSVKDHYFDHLRNIQYYLPNHKYSDIDKKLLRKNASYFSQHSKYLVHLIKSINWNYENSNNSRILLTSRSGNHYFSQTQNKYIGDRNCDNISTNDNLQFITKIINGEKTKSCSELYCTRTCQEQLSCDDCINILYSCVNILPHPLLEYLFSIIMMTPEQVILCHLSFFVKLIKQNNNNKLLQNFLFDLLSQTNKLIYHTYWFLNNSREQSNIQEINNINNFIERFETPIIRTMHQEYLFYIGLINNLDDPVKYLSSVFERCKPISVPYEPDIKLIDVDLDNIVIKSSYTKPVIITFNTTVGPIKLLFKKESIMNDVTVLNLMTLCDIILSENLNTNFGVVVYPTMPLSPNSGMIEIVDQADTVHSIVNNKKTILQHILERNEHRVIADVLDRYMYSLVSYTLHSYLIGLGDRHLQNIMITDDGAIFHIDFGFILGTDAYPLTATDIKLNTGMLDVIGNSDGSRYQLYLELCANGVILLRKYFNMFFILLSLDNKFDEKHIEKFVMSRFQPRQKDDIVIDGLMAVISQSHNAYSDCIRDFLHYHTQEKTLQNGVGQVLKTAFGMVRSLTGSK